MNSLEYVLDHLSMKNGDSQLFCRLANLPFLYAEIESSM